MSEYVKKPLKLIELGKNSNAIRLGDFNHPDELDSDGHENLTSSILVEDPRIYNDYPTGIGTTTASIMLAISTAIMNIGIEVIYRDYNLSSSVLAQRLELMLSEIKTVRGRMTLLHEGQGECEISLLYQIKKV